MFVNGNKWTKKISHLIFTDANLHAYFRALVIDFRTTDRVRVRPVTYKQFTVKKESKVKLVYIIVHSKA